GIRDLTVTGVQTCSSDLVGIDATLVDCSRLASASRLGRSQRPRAVPRRMCAATSAIILSFGAIGAALRRLAALAGATLSDCSEEIGRASCRGRGVVSGGG